MTDKPLRVLMYPQLKWFRREESGIKRVVENLLRCLPDQGIECVEEGAHYDLLVGHAGMETHAQIVHNHGMYWTADYQTEGWEWRENSRVIDALRNAKEIIVPSEWVAEVIRRDMYRQPHVIGHGVDWQAWQHDYADNHYVLWNKNRAFDVCDPRPVMELAKRFLTTRFVTTFAPPDDNQDNVQIIGLQPHETMKKLVQGASIYLSTTKETFGIGVLEALAAGTPVLGFAWGGNLDLVPHGVAGYLAQPGNYDDLSEGLRYCVAHRDKLSANARELAKAWTWERAAEKTAAVYRRAMVNEPPRVTVVIPCYNYAATVGRAIESVLGQTHELLECIVVDDGSAEDIEAVVRPYCESDRRVRFIRQSNQGVAYARNNGIAAGTGKYICCLDADDAIDRRFLAACVDALEEDHGLHLAYTGLWAIRPDGTAGKSQWPGAWDFTEQTKRRNQVPTCCVYRRQTWAALGGYRQRYAPQGAGAEDAELWYRFGAAGFRCAQVTDAPFFVYSLGSGRVSGNKQYRESDWLVFHPEVNDGKHPLASFAKPQRYSHAVRQYDRPHVSVIIPVGPGHESAVTDALDSVAGQTLRQWEAVIVWDAGGEVPAALKTAYPWGRWGSTGAEGKRGAGVARNIGRKLARAPLLLFLDADDWLYPNCLERMVEEYQITGHAVYSDFVGKAFVGDLRKLAPNLQKMVRSYNEKTGEAVIEYTQDAPYDCHRAQKQPDAERPYLWCNVTTLLPAPWFDAVGGFDEKMTSWEDVDLWWRLARRGYCFAYLKEPLLVYRFYTGTRRDEFAADNPEAAQKRRAAFEYLRAKYQEEGESMPCTSCGKKQTIHGPAPQMRQQAQQKVEVSTMKDGDFVLCRYISPNVGDHAVIGTTPFRQQIPGINMRGKGGFYFIDYGYRAGGGVEKFLVHRDDAYAQRHLFQEVEIIPSVAAGPPVPPPSPVAIPGVEPPPVAPSDEPPPRPEPPIEPGVPEIASGLRQKGPDPAFELQKLAGVSDAIAAWFVAHSILDAAAIVALPDDELQGIPGMSKRRAGMIRKAAERAVNPDAAA